MSPSRESRTSGAITPRPAALGAQVGEARLKDEFPKVLRTVAGVCTEWHSDAGELRGAAVLMSFKEFAVIDAASVRIESPARPDSEAVVSLLRSALAQLSAPPDLLFVHGHGVSHASRAGLAVRLGVLMDLPTIGVARESDVGTSKPLHEMRGAFSPLREGGVQIGWVLRSKIESPPLIVSPGHRVSMAAAPELVMDVMRSDRIPEPIRIAESYLQGE
ncbi:endonuclease V [Lysobacter soyae]|uniref:Endonuclease V n=1 Tax=Lysobacter soyae TaxID=2764185 RepID=A0ABX8WSF3_9GAMM|nr:endonuclease V [Lysobacter sp. CJ11]QYR53762.1 endonuclease V [Lysobacter sp. CJ11]